MIAQILYLCVGIVLCVVLCVRLLIGLRFHSESTRLRHRDKRQFYDCRWGHRIQGCVAQRHFNVYTLVAIIAVQILVNGCSVATIDIPDASRWKVPSSLPKTLKVPDAIKSEEKLYSYMVNGKRYWVKAVAVGYRESGLASWYGKKFHGRLTANQEVYNMYKYTAAHKSLPLPSYIKVFNHNNNKSVVVRVNDRGPFIDGRIVDLSYAAAKKIGMDKAGLAPVTIEVISIPDNQRRNRREISKRPNESRIGYGQADIHQGIEHVFNDDLKSYQIFQR